MQSTVRMEQRHAVQFSARLGRTTSETHQLLTTAYQDDAFRKPATRSYHNRVQTLGMNVYEQIPKMRKTRARRSRNARNSSNIKIENTQKLNNLGSDAESNVSDDSFNDPFLGFDTDNHSETDMNTRSHSFDESAFQNESTNYVQGQTNLHDKEINHCNEVEKFANGPINYLKEFPSSKQNYNCINDSDEICCRNEQARESFYNLDQHQSNVNLSNDINHVEDLLMETTIAVNDQYESDITADNEPVTDISGTRIAIDNDRYVSNIVENESDTEILPEESAIQGNAQDISNIETNTSQSIQQNVQGIMNRNESFTNHYYVNLNGELRLERNYFPEG